MKAVMEFSPSEVAMLKRALVHARMESVFALGSLEPHALEERLDCVTRLFEQAKKLDERDAVVMDRMVTR